MSSGPGSLQSLLQQDVSVTTVKEVRYEGKLYSYDTANFTITLQDVLCMGTENRVTATQMGPKEEVYEFIVFNANHIKSFQPIRSVERVEDPAIVSFVGEALSSGGPRGGRSSPKKSSTPMSSIMKLLDAGNQRVRSVDMDRLMNQSGGQRNNAVRGGQRPGSSNAHDASKGQQGRSASKDGNRAASRKLQQQQQNQNQKAVPAGNKRARKPPQPGSPGKQGPRHVSFQTDSSNQTEGSGGDRRQHAHIPQIPRGILSREGRRQDTRAPASPRRQRSSSVPGRFPQPKTPVHFEEEFDFDQAHEKFKELSLHDKSKDKKDDKEKKNAEGESKAAGDSGSKDAAGSDDAIAKALGPAYNQDQSFYDKLSTTTETESQQRPSRREVMMANKETFGVSYLPGRRSFFRGRTGNFQRFPAAAPNAARSNGPRSQGNGRKYNQRNFQRAFRRMVTAH